MTESIMVVKKNCRYLGFDREVETSDFYVGKKTNRLLVKYLDYLARTNDPSEIYTPKDVLLSAIDLFNALTEYGFDCEVIIKSSIPIDGFNDMKTYLLGIDVACDGESLLKCCQRCCSECDLNENGLLNSLTAYETLLNSLSKDLKPLTAPYFVYRICF